MPRDFSTYSARLRSPFNSMSRTNSQLSTRDDIPTSVLSNASPPEVRLVKKAVISRIFRKSIRRINMMLRVALVARLNQAADGIEHHHLRFEVARPSCE